MKKFFTLFLAAAITLGLALTGTQVLAEENIKTTQSLVIVFSQTGKTMALAELIAQKTGSEIYRIEPKVPFPTVEADIISSEEERRQAGKPLELASPPPDLSGYELIFLGSPTWFGETPDIVKLFVTQADFKNAKVALFTTSGTRPGQVIETLTAAVGEDRLLKPKLLQKRADDWSPDALNLKIDQWLSEVQSSKP
ncbi:MAG: hypothetical protein LBT47_11740 [Deltaproteobacteria bacterium]|jgi:flavodoxin|nr:hypothetical protein [Deltaproteobacteria bacterium]